jgi:hypothetical protein
MDERACEAEIEAWRRAHEHTYTREDGWLSQIALHPLGDEPLVLDADAGLDWHHPATVIQIAR